MKSNAPFFCRFVRLADALSEQWFKIPPELGFRLSFGVTMFPSGGVRQSEENNQHEQECKIAHLHGFTARCGLCLYILPRKTS